MPHFDRIPLSKEMFLEAKTKEMTLSELLRNHEKFSKESKLSPLEQQLAARGLALSGAHAALVGDFFKTEDNKILFVETINEMVKTGMDTTLKSFASLSDIVATRTGIAGITYSGAEVDIDNSKGNASRIGEGGKFPTVTIKFKNKSITLYKFGFEIKASYEVVRRMKVNVFAVTMKVLGRNIANQKVANAIDVLVNGDGNSNPIKSINAVTSGTLSYADIVNLTEEFEFFEPTMMLSDKGTRIKYLNLPEYKDKNGPSMPEPPKKSKAMPASKIIAMDSTSSLEEVYETGGSMVEYDKIISQQFETAVVSEVSGYSKLFPDAAIMLNI